MVAGHLCLDVIPRFPDTTATKLEQIMTPGKLVNMDEAMISTGGAVSNTGINMKTLGSNVCFCACVGDDTFGKLTLDLLRNRGDAEGVRVRNGEASAYTIVIAPPGIDRIFLHNPGTNDRFNAGDLNPELIAQCRHFHFGYPPLMASMFSDEGRELQKVFQIAKEAGATTSCDMTLPDPDSMSGKAPWRKILENILPYIDLFTPSLGEAFYMLHPLEYMKKKAERNNEDLVDSFTPADYSRMADELLAMGCKVATLKAGHRGFYVKTGSKERFETLGAAHPGDVANWAERELWTPAFKPDKFGSATGAGDASIAGLLTAYLHGLSVEEALKCAVCCSMQNVREHDALSGITSWEETTAMVATDMPVIDAHIEADGWSWSETAKLWVGPNDPLNF